MNVTIKRRIDNLGRVVIPQEMRERLKFSYNQCVDIHMEEDKIIIMKATIGCDLCGAGEHLLPKGRFQICSTCFDELRK